MNRLLLLLFIILIGCEQKPSNHPILKYYPPSDILESGYVNKYYRHYYPNNKDSRAATEITYSKLLLDDDHLVIKRYNAGFDLVGVTEQRIKDNQIINESIYEINRSDTITIEMINPVYATWASGELELEPYAIRYNYNDSYFRFEETQLSCYDTIIDGKQAKVIVSEGGYINEKTEETSNEYTNTTYYVSELGFYSSLTEGETYQLEVELMEQMSVEEFEQRANHNKHRIAWIDPKNTLDTGDDFSICGHEKFIADYYNSTPDGRYIHGKRALTDTVFNNLTEAKMLEQNGMLVFRFVVNCEGKAGRFTVDGYDFMYEPIKFEKETIDHLYGILRKLEDWRPVVINDEARDAYFYITFKIENGKITDILP